MTDCKWKGVFPGIPIMAIVANAGHRMDSIPPEGGLGCSSLSFFKEQVADRYQLCEFHPISGLNFHVISCPTT